MTPEQIGYWIGLLFGGFVVGALCGLLPLLLGIKKQRRGLALASWISCVLSGLILGLILAVPVAIIFTVVILWLKKPEQQNAVRKFAEQGPERYAVNRAPYPMNENEQTQSQTPLFLRIPVSRLIFLSIVSFSLYEVYWIYKNWRYIKERDGINIHPFWRGVFGIFFCHSLLRRIHEDKEARSIQLPTFSPGGLATGWVILIFAANIVSRAPGIAVTIISAFIPSFLCLVPVQNYINSVEEKRNLGQRFYGWSSGHIVCLVIGIIIWALLLITLSSEM